MIKWIGGLPYLPKYLTKEYFLKRWGELTATLKKWNAETKYVIPENAYATIGNHWYVAGHCLMQRPTKDMAEIEQRRAMLFPCLSDYRVKEDFYECIAKALNQQPVLRVCTKRLLDHVEGREQMTPKQLKFLKEVTKGML